MTEVTLSKINHQVIFSPAVLPEEVQFLWRQAATITPVSGLDLQVGERGPESTDSEKEREREMVEAAEAAGREQERLEPSPKEVWKYGVECLFISVVLMSISVTIEITLCLCVNRFPESLLSQKCLMYQVNKNHKTASIQ